MPGHSPDHLFVCVVDPVQHTFSSRTLCQPEYYLSIVRGTCEKFLLVRMPSYHGHLVFMSLKAVEFAVALPDVEHLDLVVTATCQEPVPIDGVPADLVNGRIVRMYLIHTSAALPRIPNLDVLVFATGQDERLGRVPVT